MKFLTICAAAFFLLTACGQSGDLFIPKDENAQPQKAPAVAK